MKLGAVASQVVATDSRAALCAALATVPGLSVSPVVPDVPTEGAAWPVWMQTTWAGLLASPGRATYDVYCLLPAGHAQTTVESADGLLNDVAMAIWNLVTIELAEPVSVRFETNQTMPGIRLRVTMRGI